MCGITGVVLGKNAKHNARKLVESMTLKLRHRGPDSGGVWSEDGVALGHRRLSILELTVAGSQPMLSGCGRYVIVFNGEIYNHRELREALLVEHAAPEWRGHSDTETLLASIVHWGLDETLVRASGMFALALWDRAAKHLFLARDRFGEKPLYWGWAGADLVFGSELKALRSHPDFPSAVCRRALAQYLRFSYVPGPRSIHPGIYKLEPGCILRLATGPAAVCPEDPLRPGESYGPISIRRYWSLNKAVDAGRDSQLHDDNHTLSALEATLRAAVGRQMLSDVPLGAFLSGGVDSSLVVAMMQQKSAEPVRTFTVGFETKAFDEAPFAAAVARHLGTDHNEIIVTDREARDVIPHLPHLYDEPFGDSSQIPTHLVSRAARSQVTVALSGDGGDELFGGYNRYLWGPRIWRRLEVLPHPLRKVLGELLSSLPVGAWNMVGSVDFGLSGVRRLGDKAHKLAERLRTVRSRGDLYLSLVSEWSPLELVRGLEYESPSIVDDVLPSSISEESIEGMMVQDIRTYLPDDILCKVDRAAMGVGLETRVPFLDPDVFDISNRLPLKMKLRNGEGKWALRQILYRHVPRELVDRPKAGFGIPVGDWLRGPLKSWATDLLSNETLARDGLINPAPVTRALDEHLSGRRDWSTKLWIILMLQAWQRSETNYTN